MAIIKRNNTKKKDIVKNIFSNIGISHLYTSKIIDDLIKILIINLFLSKSLKIKNFGTFVLKRKYKRIGRNPMNQKSYEIAERNTVLFKSAETLKKVINKNVKK